MLSPATVPDVRHGNLSTLNEDGSRRWLRPRPSRGRFWRRRRAVAWVLIAVFMLIPYLKLNGLPLILLNVAQRRFTLFGMTFLPTDTLLLALFIIGVFVLIFLLTAL
jgi:polyferredoxin